jgi:hypothetical protein
VRTYSGALTQVKDQSVEVKPLRCPRPDTEVVVRTEVRGKGDPIQLDYRLEKADAGWKIYDVNVLGFWLVDELPATSRKDQQGGLDGLIKFLAERNKAWRPSPEPPRMTAMQRCPPHADRQATPARCAQLEPALGEGSDVLEIDASRRSQFDTSAIAVLLDCRRQARPRASTMWCTVRRQAGATGRRCTAWPTCWLSGPRFSPSARVALGAQVALDLLQHRPQLGAQAQRHAGGQDVDDDQVQQARHHRAVAVVVFRVVGGQQDLLWPWRQLGPAAEPLAVITITVAPLRRAMSAASSRSRLRPELLMTTAQSPGPAWWRSSPAHGRPLTAVACTPRRKNLCCASCATMPELPTP